MSDSPDGRDRWGRSTLTSMPKRSPWMPSDEDGAIVLEATAAALAAAQPDANLLVLGVTPDLIALDWPRHVRLVAMDSSGGMIASAWQPNPSIPSRIICDWWQRMPLDDASIDVAVGDGSLNALPEFEDYPVVLEQVARVLRPGGLLAARCFLRLDPPETPEQVVALAMRGEFPTASAFRFRLALAIAGAGGTIDLMEIPPVFSALVSDRDALAQATGWPRDDIDRTDRGSPVGISFPTETELRRMVDPWFEVQAFRHGHYTQAELAPTVVLERR